MNVYDMVENLKKSLGLKKLTKKQRDELVAHLLAVYNAGVRKE